MSTEEVIRVFISYSHDCDVWAKAGKDPDTQRDRVRTLCTRLRSGGVDCHIDQQFEAPAQGWPRWMEDEIAEADFVLVVATKTYNRRFRGHEEPGRGLGGTWEGGLITKEVYNKGGRNTKFIPIVFDAPDTEHIPSPLQSTTYYQVSDDKGFEALYYRLTDQPDYVPEPLGQLRRRPERENKSPKEAATSTPPQDNLPARNLLFAGRSNVLDAVSKALLARGRAALVGMPGMGKTQIALEYAHRHRGDYRFTLWLNADSPESLAAGYLGLARVLGLHEWDAPDQDSALEAVRRWMRKEAGWLLVIDNADAPGAVRHLLPLDGLGHLLLTTRDPAVTHWAPLVEVNRLAPEEGARIILLRAGRISDCATLDLAHPDDLDAAMTISRAVDGLPLALDQAGSYMVEAPVSPLEYWELYQNEGAELRDQRGELGDRDSVSRTFTLALASVESVNPAAVDILRVGAFLGSDSIPEEVFLEGATELGDQLGAACSRKSSFLNLVGAAHRLSLVRRDVEARTLTMHRVVQDVTRDTMDAETQQLWAERTLRAVNRAFPGWEGQRTRRTLCDRLSPHAVTCLDEAERRGIKVMDVYHLLRDLGVHLENRSRFDEAESLFRRALAGFEDLCGADSVDAARMNHLVGRICRVVERKEEAEQYFRRALTIFDKILGPDHVETGTTLNSLGVLLTSSDRRQSESEGFLLRAQAIFVKLGESEATRHANNLGCLANLRSRQGRRSEAETLHHKAIAIIEAAEGVESPSLYFLLLNLSQEIRDLGRLDEAEPLLVRALNIAEKSFDPHGYQVGAGNQKIAELRKRQGRQDEAELHYRRAMEIFENVFGPESRRVADILVQVAYIAKTQGRHADAEQLYRRNVAIRQKTDGPAHSDTADGLLCLADSLCDLGRTADAIPFYRQSLDIRRTIGLDYFSAFCLKKFAMLLDKMRHDDESERLFRELLEYQLKSLGLTSSSIDTCSNIIIILNRNGKYDEIISLIDRYLSEIEQRRCKWGKLFDTLVEQTASILAAAGFALKATATRDRAKRLREQKIASSAQE